MQSLCSCCRSCFAGLWTCSRNSTNTQKALVQVCFTPNRRSKACMRIRGVLKVQMTDFCVAQSAVTKCVCSCCNGCSISNTFTLQVGHEHVHLVTSTCSIRKPVSLHHDHPVNMHTSHPPFRKSKIDQPDAAAHSKPAGLFNAGLFI